MGALGMALLGIGLLLAGAGIGFWLAKLGQSVDEAKIEEARTALDDYRREVTEHFGETAGRFQALGQQYKELYEHLAKGSEQLCDTAAMDRELLFPLPGEAALTQRDEADPQALDDESSDANAEHAADTAALEAEEAADLVAADVADGEPGAADEAEVLEAHAEADEERDTADAAAESPAESQAEPADNVVELVPRSDSAAEEKDEKEDGERTYH
ncbi:MAG: DUF1043 family protein [Pseudomonadota bacterium]